MHSTGGQPPFRFGARSASFLLALARPRRVHWKGWKVAATRSRALGEMTPVNRLRQPYISARSSDDGPLERNISTCPSRNTAFLSLVNDHSMRRKCRERRNRSPSHNDRHAAEDDYTSATLFLPPCN